MSGSQAWTVRLSELKDASEIMMLDELVWNERTAPAPLSWGSRGEFLRHAPPGSQLVAVQKNILRGYIGFQPPTSLVSNSHVLSIHIAVHPSCQREGVGSLLMHAMKELAASRGVRKLSLRVLSCNTGAIAFYRKNGFVKEGRLAAEYCISGTFIDDIIMAHHLKNDRP
ncbi:GNAT family N-acetyltransferase [Paenibacillus sp. P96]|uniref:GNAT family N-acetyltransferase n=1 Tax=Paenibacillus zeirhizosphaerae TaxID=2987519 RepID=A0ABT9FN24_9BACL|nr:GNAT family N-acetyltransferase [Paenibacillus sp. P96]MDP4096134.1 GNAT family N-acetyltransferase [Paenibacillus sp. P96]